MTTKDSHKLNVVVHKKPRHRLMESTKQEIGSEPYSSGVIGLERRGVPSGRSNVPSSNKKIDASLRSTCFLHLLIF